MRKVFTTVAPQHLSTLAGIVLSSAVCAQDGSQVHGNFSMDGQYYNEDSVIGAQKPPHTWGLYSRGNINYASGNGTFKAGVSC